MQKFFNFDNYMTFFPQEGRLLHKIFRITDLLCETLIISPLIKYFSSYFSSNLYQLRASFIAQLVTNLPAIQETPVQFLVRKIRWRRERLPTPLFWTGEFHGLYSKELDTTERLSLTFRKLRSWHQVSSLHGKQMGKQWKQCQTLFWGAPNHCRW